MKLDLNELARFWYKLCKTIINIKDQKVKVYKTDYFMMLFYDLIKIMVFRMAFTAEHMIFINDNDVGEDDDIAEYEEKNK